MMRQTRTYLTMAAIALAAASLTAAAPAIAHGVEHALFAHDSEKVDGRHAVGAGASPQQRANKLVATDDEGRLPDDIIAGEDLVRGGGTRVLTARRVREQGTPEAVLLQLPGLGTLTGECPFESGFATITWENSTSRTIDIWRDVTGSVAMTSLSPGASAPVVEVNVFTGDHDGTFVELGWGNGTTTGRTASVNAFANRFSSLGPCTFQVRATTWAAG